VNVRPTELTESFLDALRTVLGDPGGSQILLHAPEFAGNEWAYVKECIDTAWVSSAGKFVDRFEQDLAAYAGARHAVAVSNGTAALQVALVLAGVGRDDEVLIPALTFVGTANAVAHCGAVPHFVDSCEKTLGMDPEALDEYLERIAERSAGQLRNRATGRRISAIVPMHTFGHPVAMDRLMDVASRHGLVVVEDAAESLGSFFRGRHTGTFGRLGIFSFNGNKVITTGGGGAIVTDDPELARRAKHLTTTAKVPHRWSFVHDEVGWNFRLPNLNAALGCAQLERLPAMVESKRVLAARYHAAFARTDHFRPALEPVGSKSNYWLNVVLVRGGDLAKRDELLQVSNDRGYQCRPAWTLLNRLPMFRQCPSAPLDVAISLEASLINLPSSSFIQKGH